MLATRVLKSPAWLLVCAALYCTSCSNTPPEPEPPKDFDGDGVYQPFDDCPNTPADAMAGADGCPVDTDGDGVPDYLDECPDTLPGAAACRYGCELGKPIVINLVNDEFDFDKAELKPDMITALDGVIATLLSQKKLMDLTVVGHTDNIGTEEYNQGLSLRRAMAVVDHMQKNGLSNLVFKQVGKGESEPVESNETPEGRAKNRRVEVFSHTSSQH